MEPTSPVRLKESDPGRYGSPDWGALVLPGTYSVTIHKMQSGELSTTARPNVSSEDAARCTNCQSRQRALTQFIDEVDNARRIMHASGTSRRIERTARLYAASAYMQTPKADPSWLVEIDHLKRDIAK